jgi:coenzyme F420-reducing hydrogenase delta subunit
MGMEDYTRHQQGIIKRYYQNLDQITWQKLSDLVGDLYLATGKKRDRLWETAASHLQKLGVPEDRIRHVVSKQDAEMLARLVKELMERKSS